MLSTHQNNPRAGDDIRRRGREEKDKLVRIIRLNERPARLSNPLGNQQRRYALEEYKERARPI